jgi:putative redox protein
MKKIFVSVSKEHYKTEIKSQTNNLVTADVPLAVGGKDLGFSPEELLMASLSACTSMTLRMYADRKGWDLEEVKVETELQNLDDKSLFSQRLELIGNLDVEQKARMYEIANKCPIHKLLMRPIEIITELK